jgi:hypothetical protein
MSSETRLRRLLAVSVVVVLATALVSTGEIGASVAPKNTHAEQLLIDNHVPSAIRSTCRGDRKFGVPNVVGVACQPSAEGGPFEVFYIEFPRNAPIPNDLASSYALLVSQAHLWLGSSPTSGAAPCPFESSKADNDGRVLCVPSSNKRDARIAWTTESLRILTVADIHHDPDGSALMRFWTGPDSGPDR